MAILCHIAPVLLRAAVTVKREKCRRGNCVRRTRQHRLHVGKLRVVSAPKWKLQQEQDEDLRPVLRWLRAQCRPDWGDIAGCSLVTKGTVVQIQHSG